MHLDRASTNLPALPSTFVNREREAADLAGLLAEQRLVTLTGPTGVGKSRLAVQVGTSVAGRYADGVWLVELAATTDPSLVPGAVAAVLGVVDQPGRGPSVNLAAYLADRHTLLVLDNCEHLLSACAQLADELLCACPGLSVLTTSQEPLGLTGEQLWPLPGLSIPDTAAEPAPAELTDHAAVRLFVERAGTVDPAFTLTAANAGAVADVCRRLDGNPLAIEFAAARVDVLSPSELAAGLADRFRLLTGGSRTALPRHRTLQAALDWSHDLLTSSEQALLRRLSVFAGGWDLAAATEVCADGELLAADEVFDLLASLVTKSLVVAQPAGDTSRYRLLETTRHYARERLVEAGEADAIDGRHAAWCLRLAERAEPELEQGEQEQWVERLVADHDNLRAALAWATTSGHTELALRLAGAFSLFWSMRGHDREGRQWLETVAAEGGAPPALRAKALWGAGWLAHDLGEYAAVRSCGEDSLALARTADADALQARALLVLGIADAFGDDDPDGALARLEQSRTLAQAAGDGWCVGSTLVAAGHAHQLRGDPASARASFEQYLDAAAPAARAGESRRTRRLHGLVGLGSATLAAGDHDTADASLREASELSRRLGHRFAEANILRLRGQLAQHQGAYEEAARLLEQSLALGRRLGAAIPLVHALASLGSLRRVTGEPERARELLDEAERVAAEVGLRGRWSMWQAERGAAERALGNHEAARAKLGEALRGARGVGDRRTVAAALSALARLARLDDGERAAALHREALRLCEEAGDNAGVADSLEGLAGLEAAQGRGAAGARLFGAAQALRDAHHLARPPADQPTYETDVATARAALPADDFETAWHEGATASAHEAISYASRGRGHPAAAFIGWEALTPTERRVATLASQRLTNAEIAGRLFISPRTVGNHLYRIYSKLGASSRKELAALVPHDV